MVSRHCAAAVVLAVLMAAPAAAGTEEALGRAEAFRQIAGVSLIEAMSYRMSPEAARQIAAIALVFDPEGRAEPLSALLGGALVSVHGIGSAAPLSSHYDAFADIGLLVRWDAEFERMDELVMVPGAALRGEAMPYEGAAGWEGIALSTPLAIGVNAARTLIALEDGCRGGADAPDCAWHDTDAEGLGIMATAAMLLDLRARIGVSALTGPEPEAVAVRAGWNGLLDGFAHGGDLRVSLPDGSGQGLALLPAGVWSGFRPAVFGMSGEGSVLVMRSGSHPDLFVALETGPDGVVAAADVLSFSGFVDHADLVGDLVR